MLQLDQSTDFEERRKIRAALRDLRNKRFKTVNIYETPSISTSSTITLLSLANATSDTKQEVKVPVKQSHVETQRPPEEAIFHAPVTERVHVVRKSQSFKSDREIHGADRTVNSKSAARNFLSSHLAELAINGTDSASSSGADVRKAFGVGGKVTGRSQSFKLLASKFENNGSSESLSNTGLSSSHNGSFRSLQGTDQQVPLKSVSPVVETEQVNQVVKVGRTHSLKLPSHRGDLSHSDAPPIGSLAHSYNGKAMKLMSGSDTNISHLGISGRDSLTFNRPIRPFMKHNGVTAVTTVDRSRDKSDDNVENPPASMCDYPSNSPPMHASVENLRHQTGVHRSGSLHSSSPSPLLTAVEMSKVKRTGSLRNAPLKSGERFVWRNSSPANIQEYLESRNSTQEEENQQGISSFDVKSQPIRSSEVSLNLSRSSTELTNESQLNSSGEERLARKALEKARGLNKYDDIQDEDVLSQMVGV